MVFVLWLQWAPCHLVVPERQSVLLGCGGASNDNSPKPTRLDPRNPVSVACPFGQ